MPIRKDIIWLVGIIVFLGASLRAETYNVPGFNLSFELPDDWQVMEQQAYNEQLQRGKDYLTKEQDNGSLENEEGINLIVAAKSGAGVNVVNFQALLCNEVTEHTPETVSGYFKEMFDAHGVVESELITHGEYSVDGTPFQAYVFSMHNHDVHVMHLIQITQSDTHTLIFIGSAMRAEGNRKIQSIFRSVKRLRNEPAEGAASSTSTFPQ